jgi:HKD family nuclease
MATSEPMAQRTKSTKTSSNRQSDPDHPDPGSISFDIVTSAPGFTLRDRALALCQSAQEIWIASAFISEDILGELCECVGPEVERVRIVTGTYGNFNRESLFQSLLNLTRNKRFEVRVWQGADRANFHAKLYLWRLGGATESWIGSANFTGTGMESPGEALASVRGSSNARQIRQLEGAFERIWECGESLQKNFLAGYKQSRLGKSINDTSVGTRRRSPRVEVGESSVLVRTIGPNDPPDDYEQLRRIGKREVGRLQNSAGVNRANSRPPARVSQTLDRPLVWNYSTSPAASKIEKGGFLCEIDPESNTVELYRVHSTVPHGANTVLVLDEESELRVGLWREKVFPRMKSATLLTEMEPETHLLSVTKVPRFLSVLRSLAAMSAPYAERSSPEPERSRKKSRRSRTAE